MRLILGIVAAVLLAGCAPQADIQSRCEADGNAEADCACFTGVLQASLSRPQLEAFARLQTIDPDTDDPDEPEAARRTVGIDGGLKIAAAAAQCNVTRGWFEDRSPEPEEPEAPETPQD